MGSHPTLHHPLQRFPSPSLGVSALVHVAGLATFAALFKYLIDNPSPVTDAYGWHFQYLTIIGLTIATLTFVAGLAADLTSSCRLFAIKNFLSVCSTPLEVLISVLYWSIRFIDESLVLQEWQEPSLAADVGFHAVPAIILVFDLLYLSPPWTITFLPSMALATAITFGYWFWVELCYTYNGWYPYPLFEQLTTPWRVALFMFGGFLMALNTVILQWLYARANGLVKQAAAASKRN